MHSKFTEMVADKGGLAESARNIDMRALALEGVGALVHQTHGQTLNEWVTFYLIQNEMKNLVIKMPKDNIQAPDLNLFPA